MRNFLTKVVAVLVLVAATGGWGTAQVLDQKGALKQTKAHQKEERAALKLKEKYMRQSLKDQQLSKSERLRLRHEMQREWRELRARQKNELQDLQDRQRATKELQNRY